MKLTHFVSTLLVALAAANAAHAADIAATVDLGTTGLGLHLTTPLAAQLNARVGLNYANYSSSGNTSDVQYDFKLKLASIDALLDYHPFGGAFRVSGGLIHNGNSIDVNARPNANGSYTINGRNYSAASVGQMKGEVEFRKVAPYLGIGWGNAAQAAGWGVGMDLGVAFQGRPRTSLVSTGCAALAAVCTQIANDVAAENAKLAEEVKDLKFYPVVRVGVSYRF
ncbi:MAG: hypothetical protein JWQ80_3491 [Massilia sp.]|nr:hypothetical protein [Massilia sp.]